MGDNTPLLSDESNYLSELENVFKYFENLEDSTKIFDQIYELAKELHQNPPNIKDSLLVLSGQVPYMIEKTSKLMNAKKVLADNQLGWLNSLENVFAKCLTEVRRNSDIFKTLEQDIRSLKSKNCLTLTHELTTALKCLKTSKGFDEFANAFDSLVWFKGQLYLLILCLHLFNHETVDTIKVIKDIVSDLESYVKLWRELSQGITSPISSQPVREWPWISIWLTV